MKYFILVLLVLTGCQKNTQNNYHLSQCTAAFGGASPAEWAQPQVVYLHHGVPDSALLPIYNAAQAWNKVLGREAIMIAVERKGGHPGNDGLNVIYFTGNWPADRDAREQARTTRFWSGGYMIDADIQVNKQNISYETLDMESLFIHEFGHFLGLGHQSDPHSVMYSTLGATQVRREISDEDYYNINCIYTK